MEHDIKTIKNKVFAENQAREIINSIVPKIIAVLKPYAEKDIKQEVIDKLNNTTRIKPILKQNYSLMKKIQDEINPFLEKDMPIKPLQEGDIAKISYLYVNSGEYDVNLKFSICYIGENYNFYYESYKYICSIKHRAIEKFYAIEEQQPLNEEEQINLYKEAVKKKEELEAVKDKMFYAFTSLV